MTSSAGATTDGPNSSEVFIGIGSSPAVLPGFPPFPGPPALPLASIMVGLVTGVTGMCANAVVFVVLIHARRHFGENVNTLIANQSAMDLCACISMPSPK